MSKLVVVVLSTILFALGLAAAMIPLEERTYVGDVENKGYVEVPND